MENNLKAAVIGCGGAGQVNHIPWYSQNKDVELVGLVDTNIDLVKKNPQWKEHFFTDPKEMLEKVKPDLVSIASPVHLHCNTRCYVWITVAMFFVRNQWLRAWQSARR